MFPPIADSLVYLRAGIGIRSASVVALLGDTVREIAVGQKSIRGGEVAEHLCGEVGDDLVALLKTSQAVQCFLFIFSFVSFRVFRGQYSLLFSLQT